MLEGIRAFGRLAANLLATRSPQEREKRAAHAVALLLVTIVAIVKLVTGVTGHDAPFTLYAVAVAASAARGGFAPALVATLASILFSGLNAPSPGWHERLLFAVEGGAIALIVSAFRSRVQASQGRFRAAEAAVAELRLRDRHRRLLDAALRHLEDAAGETAVVVLNDLGLIAEWRTGAERLYGYSSADVIGASATALFFAALSPSELSTLLHESEAAGVLRRSDVHRRRDGARVDVDLEIKPFRDAEARGFTLTVHDTTRRREWDKYRQDATRAQAAVQQAADEARQQLAAIESLTDPSLNPLEGPAMVTELLERLRASVRADGVALVRPGRVGGVTTARGLGAAARPLEALPGPVGQGFEPALGIGAESLQLAPGRVAVVHNNPAQLEQLSMLRWSAEVVSLLVVPVVHNAQVWATIEVVSERSRQVTDWDVALVRIVADRLAAVVVQDRGLAAKAS
jgi:PAS domain S-box-containing protein